MPYVEFYRLKDDGDQEIIAICRLENGSVICEGDESLIQFLQESGITDYRSQENIKLYPKDGITYLEQLSNNFRSGYLNASEVKES